MTPEQLADDLTTACRVAGWLPPGYKFVFDLSPIPKVVEDPVTPEQLARELIVSGIRHRFYIDPAMVRPPLPHGLRRWTHSKGCRQWHQYRHQPCLLLILRPAT